MMMLMALVVVAFVLVVVTFMLVVMAFVVMTFVTMLMFFEFMVVMMFVAMRASWNHTQHQSDGQYNDEFLHN